MNSKQQKRLTIPVPKVQSKLPVLFLLVLSVSLVTIPITNVYAVLPGQVTGLTATAQTNALTIDLSWDAVTATPAVTGYKIERKVGAGAFSTLVADTGSTATTYSDTGLAEGTMYTYRVSAINADGTGPASAEASDTTNSSPGAPTGLTATKQTNALTIDLSWTAPASNGGSVITGYKIERESPTGGGFSTLVADTGTTTTTYSDTGLTANTQYNYRVSAINAIGTGSPSNEASDTTNNVPGAPTGLTATAQADALTIDLSWTAPASDGGSAITGYKIERESPTGGGFSVLVADTGSTATTYSNTGLTKGTQYNYRVSAINAIGTGSVSNEASATTSDVPDAPTLSVATVSKFGITISWTTPNNQGSAITGYKIEKSTGGGFSTLVGNTGTTTTSLKDSSVTKNQEVSYRVSAINSIGTGNPSNTAGAKSYSQPLDCYDCNPPSFTDWAGASPLMIAGEKFKIASNVANKIDTVVANTGTPFSIKLLLYDDNGPNQIQHVALYANLREHQISISQSDTYIIWEKGKDVVVEDPHGFLKDTKVTAQVSGEYSNGFEVIFDLSFAKPLEKSHLILSTWDERRNGSITKIFDALRVVGEQLQTEIDISEEETNKVPSIIPGQLKEQIIKKVQGPIKDSDVAFVLTELAKKEVLVIKDLHIQNEKSLDESRIVSSGSDAGVLNAQKGYSRNSDLLIMQGDVSDYTRGAKIWIEIAKPDKSTQTLSFYPNKDGSFYLPLILDGNSRDGFYKVTATYKDVTIGDLSFTMGYKSKIESAKPILKNIIQSWLKGSISDDVFVERVKNLLK